MKALLLFACFLSISLCSSEEENLPLLPLYNQISSLTHPTYDDLRLIQQYLTHGERPYLERLDDSYPGARNMQIIGDAPHDLPSSGLLTVNCQDNERENCIVLYASLNRSYPKGLHRLIKLITASDFRGHILYYIGGWPDLEGGSLRIAHVPYTFKVAALREAQRLGFKRLFWLDASIKPYVSLNTLFEMIQDQGFFAPANNHMISPFMNPDAGQFFGISYIKTFSILSCQSGMVGLDLTQPVGSEILKRWYNASFDPCACYSARSDQNALTMVLYQLRLLDKMIPFHRIAQSPEEIGEHTLLIVDRGYAYGWTTAE